METPKKTAKDRLIEIFQDKPIGAVMTWKEVAQALGVSDSTIDRLISAQETLLKEGVMVVRTVSFVKCGPPSAAPCITKVTDDASRIMSKVTDDAPSIMPKVGDDAPRVTKTADDAPRIMSKVTSDAPRVMPKVADDAPRVMSKATDDAPRITKATSDASRIMPKVNSDASRIMSKAADDAPRIMSKVTSDAPRITKTADDAPSITAKTGSDGDDSEALPFDLPEGYQVGWHKYIGRVVVNERGLIDERLTNILNPAHKALTSVRAGDF